MHKQHRRCVFDKCHHRLDLSMRHVCSKHEQICNMTWHAICKLVLPSCNSNDNPWPKVHIADMHRPAYLCMQHLHTNITVEAINAFQVVVVYPQYFQIHLYNRL